LSLPDVVARNGLSDVYAAQWFVGRHGNKWRYDHTRRLWMKFHEPLWRPEGPGEIKRLLIACAQEFQRHAQMIQDSTARDKALGFGKFWQTQPGLSRIATVAQSLEPIAVDGSAWNRDPWLVGCPNGVIDLRTGSLRNGAGDHHISLSLGVPF